MRAGRMVIRMDARPIAVFDSGLGGLTAVRELHRILPNESIVYFGDTGRIPYGTRSDETVIKYVRQDIRFLMTFDVKLIFIACGTASSIALEAVRSDAGVPLYGVVPATAAAAARASRNKKIGVTGTSATIRTGAYRRALKLIDPDIEVIETACPLFVPLVEAGRVSAGDVVIETVAREYLTPLKDAGVDTLILGCTHYPLISGVISACMGEGVTLIDSGREAAREIAGRLGQADMLSPGKKGETSYYVSDSVEAFTSLGGMFLRAGITGRVAKVDIEKY